MRPGAALALAPALAACALFPPRAEEPLVDVHKLDRNIYVEIRYATPHNFTHQTLYPVNRCLLRESVAKRLSLIQADLNVSGLGLKVWDCYRPLSIQEKLWKVVHDPRYVADPKKGSRHNRGAAVDVTLIDMTTQKELPMPTDYDDFSPRAHRDSSDASPEALANRSLLDEAMRRRGFVGLPTEWWHFDATGWRSYPIMDVPLEQAAPQ